MIIVPESALCLSFRLPAAVYGQGKVDLALGGRNRNAVLSQILIWERTRGGSQSNGSVNLGDNGLIMINPNPSFNKVDITFTITGQSMTYLKIYDATGKLVRSTNLGILSAGKHRTILDKNLTEILPSGIYFIELNAGNIKMSERFVYWK
jgi:hypothetical protein